MSRSHLHAQHFLRSPRLVAELIGHSNIRKNDTVYDLGAGSGVITTALARRCKQVIAVEIEPSALKSLRQNISSLDNVTVIEKDILQLDPPDQPYKIFSNIPFFRIALQSFENSLSSTALQKASTSSFKNNLLANSFPATTISRASCRQKSVRGSLFVSVSRYAKPISPRHLPLIPS